VQDRGKFPREVHGVVDPRVHDLSPDRTVNVPGIAQEERAPAAEPVRDPMVDVISREPVHPFDVDP
jgi:hypothetical protein